MRNALLLAAVLTVAGLAQASAEDFDARDLSWEQTIVANVQPPKVGSLKVTAWVDRRSNVYKVGQQVRLFVKVNKDAYVGVYSVGPSGSAVVLYPNAYQPAIQTEADQILEIPGEGAGAAIVASGQPGIELIRVVAATSPLSVLAALNQSDGEPFRSVDGGAESVARDLQLIKADEVDFYDKIIKTTADQSGAATPDQDEDLATTGGVVSTLLPVTVGPTGDDRAPILLALDKPVYRIGDLVTMSVTTLEECYLWVIDIAPDRTARVLFPNQIVQDNHIRANQTVLVSGGPSPVRVQAAGPAGRDLVYALCGPDPTAPWKAGVDFSQMFAELDKSDPLAKALVVATPDAPQELDIPDRFAWTSTTLTVTED